MEFCFEFCIEFSFEFYPEAPSLFTREPPLRGAGWDLSLAAGTNLEATFSDTVSL